MKILKNLGGCFAVFLLVACNGQNSTTVSKDLSQPVGSDNNKAGEVISTAQQDLDDIATQLNLSAPSLDTGSDTLSVPTVVLGAPEYSDGNIVYSLNGQTAGDIAEGSLVTYWKQVAGPSAFIFDSGATQTQVLLPSVTRPETLLFRLFAINSTANAAAFDEFELTVLPTSSEYRLLSTIFEPDDSDGTFKVALKDAFSNPVKFNYVIEPYDSASNIDLSAYNGSLTVAAGTTDIDIHIPGLAALFEQTDGIFKLSLFSEGLDIPIQMTAYGVAKNVNTSSSADFSLQGVSLTSFNAIGSDITLNIESAAFSQDKSTLSASINGNPISSDTIELSPTAVLIPNALVDGKNQFDFVHFDSQGQSINYSVELWAGQNLVTINLVDELGSPITEAANVKLILTDNTDVVSALSADDGSITFENIPGRTLVAEASTADNSRSGSVSLVGTQSIVALTMSGFDQVSEVDNNDFSEGLAGWNVANNNSASIQVNAEDGSNDLFLSTQDEGKQTLTRTFITQPGVTGVRVRFRFITDEIPGGYFGSKFNDTYSISIRTVAGGNISESSSMNGLGLEAFDQSTGQTGWRDVVLPTVAGGDTIQVLISVTNVGDGSYDSTVVVDFVEEIFGAES